VIHGYGEPDREVLAPADARRAVERPEADDGRRRRRADGGGRGEDREAVGIEGGPGQGNLVGRPGDEVGIRDELELRRVDGGVRTRCPARAGLNWRAIVAASTGPLKATPKRVAVVACPAASGPAVMTAVVAPRVRKAARTRRSSGWPLASSAPASTVMVWSVPGAQLARGVTVRCVIVASQVSRTAVAGSTDRSASTEAPFIALGKLTTIAARGDSPVSMAVVNSEAAIVGPWVGAVPAAGVGRIAAAASAPAMTVTTMRMGRRLPGRRTRVPA
jgi:hypothetical protein